MRSLLHRPIVVDCELSGRHADRGEYVDALNEKDAEIGALRAQVAERDRIIGRLLAGEAVAAADVAALDADHATGCCARDGIDCPACMTGRCHECLECIHGPIHGDRSGDDEDAYYDPDED